MNFHGLNRIIYTKLIPSLLVNSKCSKKLLHQINLLSFDNSIITKILADSKILSEGKKKHLSFLLNLKNYRSIRHKQKLPCRGQRTKTNSRTVRRV